MSSKIKVDTIETVSGSGNVTVASGNALRVASGDLVVAGGNTALTGNLNASGTSTLQGNATVGGTLGVTGASTLSAATVSGDLQVGGSSPVSTAGIMSVINAGNSLEWGHGNAAGYRSTLGAMSGGGQPFVALSAEHGTNSNTYRTRGLKGTLISADNAGAMLFQSVTTATADNQTPVTNAYIENAGTTVISPAGSELARFSGTQFMVGKTAGNFTTAGSIQQKSGADGSPAYFYQVKTYSGTRNSYLNYHNGTYVGGINMTNTSTSFPTSSDERLKKNIKDAPSGGDKIDAMKVRSFNWKVDDSLQEYGLVAQELEKVYDWPVESLDNGDAYTIDYTKLVPIMLKEIQDLRKRVATLESS